MSEINQNPNENTTPKQPQNQNNENKFCKNCGSQLMQNDKFCINCGNKVYETTNYNTANTLFAIKQSIKNLFDKNSIISFISKYAFALSLLFPIYVILSRFDNFEKLTNVIGYIWIPLQYLYYFSIFINYIKNKYIYCAVPIIIRGTASLITVFRASDMNTDVFSALLRITFICILLYLFYLDNKKSQEIKL